MILEKTKETTIKRLKKCIVLQKELIKNLNKCDTKREYFKLIKKYIKENKR